MKLLYIANIRFPSERAHAVQVAHMCHAFSSNDIETTLLVPNRKGVVSVEWWKYYNIAKNFTVAHVYCSPWNVGTKFKYFVNLFIFTVRSLVMVRKDDYDLCYSRDEFILFVLSFFVESKKLAWESHEAKYNFLTKRLTRKQIRTIAISEGIRDFYIDQGVKSDLILVAHDGIDNSFFEELETKESARARLGLPTDKKIALYIGGLERWKGVDTFFKASALCPSVYFAAIGGTIDQINSFKNSYPTVHFLGRSPYSELKNNQQAADVLIIPNTAKEALSARYTSPLKLFAHMTSRVPIVASRLPSIESVLSEKEVIWFKPDDPYSLAKAVHTVCGGLVETREIAENAFLKSKRYTWECRAKSIISYVMKDDSLYKR